MDIAVTPTPIKPLKIKSINRFPNLISLIRNIIIKGIIRIIGVRRKTSMKYLETENCGINDLTKRILTKKRMKKTNILIQITL